VTTQLRLVEAPGRSEPRAALKRATTNTKSTKGRKTPKSGSATAARRPVNWGEWQLDARTRRVGRAGVAAARQALEEARAAQQLQQAS
jgi:hypothetical protein